MGLFDWLLGRKGESSSPGPVPTPAVPLTPQALAQLAGAQASAHLLALAQELGKRASSASWAQAHQELVRAYFGLASLYAGGRISDPAAFSRFGGAMLDALCEPTDPQIREIHRAALQGDACVSDAVCTYVRGQPSPEDLEVARQCAAQLELDFDDAVRMLCAHLHLRLMGLFGVATTEARFLESWKLTAELVEQAWSEMAARFGGPG